MLTRRRFAKPYRASSAHLARTSARPLFSVPLFDYSGFVSRQYRLHDAEAAVFATVPGYTSVISEYSVPGQPWLADGFAAYVDNATASIPSDKLAVLTLVGGSFSDSQKVLITRVIAEHYGLGLGRAELEYRRNTRRVIYLVILTILSALAFAYFRIYVEGTVWDEFIFLGVWFSGWELADAASYLRADLRRGLHKAQQRAALKVQFSDGALFSEGAQFGEGSQ